MDKKNFRTVEKILHNHNNDTCYLCDILESIQKKFSYLPENVIEYVANNLNISTSEIYAKAKFYAQ